VVPAPLPKSTRAKKALPVVKVPSGLRLRPKPTVVIAVAPPRMERPPAPTVRPAKSVAVPLF
jgi:hypothetical protein